MLFGGYGCTTSETCSYYQTMEDIWVFNKASKQWIHVGGNLAVFDTSPDYTSYRSGSSLIGARGSYAAASELTNRGNFIIFGGETSDVCC